MRTETITKTIYKFDELSDDQKESALEKFRGFDDLYLSKALLANSGEENLDSLKGFCDHFDLDLKDWSISLWGNSYADISVRDENAEGLSGVRLWKYLQNNYLTLPETKWDEQKKKIVKTGKKVSLLNGQCPFTGYCLDESLLDDIRAFMKKPDRHTDFRSLMNDCVSSWVHACVRDWEYAYSDDGITEMIQGNDYEFYEDGSLV